MSNIIKGLQLNEVDPRNFDSDIDYYNALNRRSRKPSIDDYDSSDFEKYDDEPIQREPAKGSRPEYSVSKDEDKNAGYNMILTVKAPTTQAAMMAAESYVDSNWGAKKQVGKIQPIGDGVVQVHMIDNHKYGMWKPWKDEDPIAKPISFGESSDITTDMSSYQQLKQILKQVDKRGKMNLVKILDKELTLSEEPIAELSPETLASYKKKAGQSASQADKEGNYKLGDKRFSGIVRATKKELEKDVAKHYKEGVAEGWDPDTTRLEQDVRDALENGDDYTAKQYAKMAPTPEAKKYLLNIIKQAMYLDDLGGETDWKGVAEGSNNIEVGDKITWWYNKFHPNYEGIVRRVSGNTIDVYAPGSGSMYRLTKQDIRSHEKKGVAEDLEESFDMKINELTINEDWQKVNKSDKTDGMSKKAVKAYRRENPGSKLKTAVTTKPSKLKKGSKAAKRRKSFCARMSGMKKAHASAKTKRDPDSPINKALRRWNCESIEQMQELMMVAEQKIREAKNAKQQAAIAIAKKEKSVKESAILKGLK